MQSISIVVRALNEAEHLPALFTGLLRQSRQPDEVVLVDSGSTDDTIAIAEAHGARILHIDPNDFSFGRSLNLGCSSASGDILVFVSAHVYPVEEDWLAKLVEPFESDDVALVYGRQTGDHRSKFSELQLMRQWFPNESDDDQGTPFCNNANCAVRRSWWQDLPYDETLTGLEDLDWARRALDKGARIAYRADAAIAHIHEETFGRTRNRYRREAIAHRKIFNDQHLGTFESIGLFLANVVRDYAAAIPRRRLLRNLAAIPTFRAAQHLGAWEGFRTQGDITADLRRRFYYPKGFSAREGSNRSKGSRPR